MTVAGAATSLDTQAAALVAAVRPRDLAALLAKYPEAEEIGLRSDPESYNPHSLKRPPQDPKRRADYLADKIETYRWEVERDIERYNALRDRGFAAVSTYDIVISGSCNALGALKTALDLKTAHISYGLTMMRNLHLELDALNAANGIAPKTEHF